MVAKARSDGRVGHAGGKARGGEGEDAGDRDLRLADRPALAERAALVRAHHHPADQRQGDAAVEEDDERALVDDAATEMFRATDIRPTTSAARMREAA